MTTSHLKQYLHDLPGGKGFYYRIFEEYPNSLHSVYPGWETCLGYIGDLIVHSLFGASECTSWCESRDEDGILTWEPESDYFVIATCYIRPDVIDEIVSTINRTSKNWNMDLTIELVNADDSSNRSAIFIRISADKMLSTKWKIQGLLQIIRCMYYKEPIINNNKFFEINGKQYTHYTIGKSYDMVTFGLLYSLSFVPIDDELHFLDENDECYKHNDITSTSHEIGAMTLIHEIFEHYVFKDKK